MERAGMRYRRHDNCFTWIEDFDHAQKLMDEQLKSNWGALLDGITPQIHPLFGELCKRYPMKYYWSCTQSEWAMDSSSNSPLRSSAVSDSMASPAAPCIRSNRRFTRCCKPSIGGNSRFMGYAIVTCNPSSIPLPQDQSRATPPFRCHQPETATSPGAWLIEETPAYASLPGL
jgi:hypothetical protein